MDISKIGLGYRPRAPFASQPQKSRGRLFHESESEIRTPFQRDRDRLIHSTAFRRLKHKTQVFIACEGDHYRTRLTHTLEVAQIARTLARALCLDEDLAEAVALAHDFGHPPFGHAGEDALNELMDSYGGFDHNAHGLRIVTKIESRYAAFDGLNLSWETLEGLVKHNGPLLGPHSANRPVHESILEYNRRHDLMLDCFASLEAQCAAIADDIAYDAHDIDDGIRAGLLEFDQLASLNLTGNILQEVKDTYPNLDKSRLSNEIERRQIATMIEDVLNTAQQNLATYCPQNQLDIYQAGRAFIHFSPAMVAQEKQLKSFLFNNLYGHPNVLKVRNQAKTMLHQLFHHYQEYPENLPPEWSKKSQDLNETAMAHLIGDFLAGMTDNYAFYEYRRLFDH